MYLPADDFPRVVRTALAHSLDALHTDHIDLYLLHRDNREMPVGEILEPMNAVIDRGAVRASRASNWECRRVIEAQEYAAKHGLAGFSVVSNTPTLARPLANFFRGGITTDPFGERWHQETGILLLSWASQAQGFYTGRYRLSQRGDSSLSDFDGRMYTCYGSDENFEQLRREEVLGEREGYLRVEIALSWLLHRPFPIVPVVGPRNRDELQSCISATRLSLTNEEQGWLNLTGSDAPGA